MFWLLQKLRSCITLLIAITTGSITAVASFFFGKAPWFFIVAVSMASVITVLVVGTGWQDYQLLQKNLRLTKIRSARNKFYGGNPVVD